MAVTSRPARTSGASALWLRLVPWLGTALRLLLGIVFVVAGSTKVTDLAASGRAVNAYQLMPFGAAKVVGAALPLVEITVGGLLILGLATRVMAILTGGLLAVYIFGISSVWVRGLSIDCGCFSQGGQLAPGQHPNYLWDLVRDVLLLLAALFVVVYPRTRIAVDGWLLGENVVEDDDSTEDDQ
ncbi:MAG TPA: MauE/DoxX family redox-associated membrane protein [Rugosimonospora sp.]|nr:MauE/DoxX family redox-associated membrane protein [Rugosimonospora sp.]